MAESNLSALTRTRPRADYTTAERDFSCLLRRRVQDVLQGKCNRLEILRKYPNDPRRVGIMGTPHGFPREQLRPTTVEQLTWDVFSMVAVEANGGPIAQSEAADGSLVEIQTFPTKYPHVLVERIDRFIDGESAADAITWSLQRVQNQQAQSSLHRMFDATSMLFELVRLVY